MMIAPPTTIKKRLLVGICKKFSRFAQRRDGSNSRDQALSDLSRQSYAVEFANVETTNPAPKVNVRQSSGVFQRMKTRCQSHPHMQSSGSEVILSKQSSGKRTEHFAAINECTNEASKSTRTTNPRRKQSVNRLERIVEGDERDLNEEVGL